VPRRWQDLLALLGYAAVSFAYFGWRLLPHPGRVLTGFGNDNQIYVWSFAWWPHAIGSWTNPLVSHALYAPDGVNLAWTLTVPGLALVFSPLTAAAGPVVAYNVAALLMPALGAWTAYLLCRYLTGSLWASLVGGYLFGFSLAILRQQLFGHLPVTAVFLVPLVALVAVRFVRGDLDARGLAWRLGVVLAAQLWLSTEYALTLTIFFALALALAFALMPAARPRLQAALVPVAGGYAVAAVLASPLIVYALLGLVPGWTVDASGSGTDLLSFAVPSHLVAVGGSSLVSVSSHLAAGGASAYVGLPTLVVIAWLAVAKRRTESTRFLVAAFVVASVLTLGTDLRVYGHRLIPLPWDALAHVPFLKGALPFRFATYVSLAAAVTVAVWIASTRGRVYPRPYLLPVLAVAALVPAVWRTTYPSFEPTHPDRVAFFTDDLYRSCLGRGETLAIFPFGGGGYSLLWQAETGFAFDLASDGLQAPVRFGKPLNKFDADPVVYDLNWADFGHPTMVRLLAFAATHDVDRVLSVPSGGYPSAAQMRSFGPVQEVGGLLVAPACGRPSLQTRNLAPYVEAAQRLDANIGWCTGVNYTSVPEGLIPAGPLRAARHANFIEGKGLTCLPPPAGYKREGFAPADLGVPANTYPYYSP